MRIQSSLKNMYIGILTQIVITLLGFISRKVFVSGLGTEYLGVNGLLTNVLSMLSLVEGGIGTSIVYNLYKPLADNDIEKVTALVQLYKKLYGILAVVVAILSLMLYPFLGSLMKDGSSGTYISVVYFIFVAKNIISYLNAHKWSLINADQKGYVLAKINLIFNVITTLCRIAIVYFTRSYILYLLVELIIIIIQNIYNGNIVNTRYPYIKTKEKYKVDKDVRENMITNVKALFLHKVGSYCVFGTDNILISALISIKTVGIYSNYTMIIGQLSALINPVLNGINASVGNLVATEGKDKNYKIFKVVYLVNFWMYCVSSIFLYNLLNPFIDWWLGEGLLLDNFTLIVVLINFYISGLRTSVGIFKDKAGIFSDDKYVPLIESIINLGASLILVNYVGLAGIFLGTTISSIALPVWNQSRLVYKKVFKRSLNEYFKRYFVYAGITIILSVVVTITCNIFVEGYSFFSLVIRGCICVTIPNIILVFIFYKTEEFKYLWSIAKNILHLKFVNKIKKESMNV
ncbi:lipopolysaccharide biosynthesis protein [Clostridium sp. 29_15]|uniref:lipopolysaccharide biosynthesis protein n=1 Tax=Clostridium sp. 29_15 TaxID=1896982 RepID=UPI00095B221D|nr:oligosaccharide flippase family protein [Clostridium sp. 29_15]OKZ87597.1 MAG: hypothetical protein BHW04_05120 [Clostridium sp. 29_15]